MIWKTDIMTEMVCHGWNGMDRRGTLMRAEQYFMSKPSLLILVADTHPPTPTPSFLNTSAHCSLQYKDSVGGGGRSSATTHRLDGWRSMEAI